MKKIILSAVLVAAATTSFAQVGIGTTSPDASAALEISSTTQGFLPPRMTEVEMTTLVGTAAEGLMVYCTDCADKGTYVYTGVAFVQTGGGAVSDRVVSASGETWMTMNLGATRIATASNDPQAYGDLYQWGRNTDGHEKRNSDTLTGPVASAAAAGAHFIKSDTAPFDWLSTQDDALWGATKTANDPCPAGFRVPTEAELNAERLLFATNDAAGAFGSVLKLPVAGHRNNANATLSNVGSKGFYWTSTISGVKSYYLHIEMSLSVTAFVNRSYGFSVRCIKE